MTEDPAAVLSDHGFRLCQARCMADQVLVCDNGTITAAFKDRDRLASLLDSSGG